jgi:myosin-5
LDNPRAFHYLNQSNCYELDGIDDSKDYIATRRAMEVVGISAGEQVFHRKLVQLEDMNLQV